MSQQQAGRQEEGGQKARREAIDRTHLLSFIIHNS